MILANYPTKVNYQVQCIVILAFEPTDEQMSIYLNQLGFDVLGVDLSENSIGIAKKNENDTWLI